MGKLTSVDQALQAASAIADVEAAEALLSPRYIEFPDMGIATLDLIDADGNAGIAVLQGKSGTLCYVSLEYSLTEANAIVAEAVPGKRMGVFGVRTSEQADEKGDDFVVLPGGITHFKCSGSRQESDSGFPVLMRIFGELTIKGNLAPVRADATRDIKASLAGIDLSSLI